MCYCDIHMCLGCVNSCLFMSCYCLYILFMQFECCGISGVQNWTDRTPPLINISYPISCCSNQTSPRCGQIDGINDGIVFIQVF